MDIRPDQVLPEAAAKGKLTPEDWAFARWLWQQTAPEGSPPFEALPPSQKKFAVMLSRLVD